MIFSLAGSSKQASSVADAVSHGKGRFINMGKNIVFFADGTWNDPASKTNVHKLFEVLAGDDDRRVPRDGNIDVHSIRNAKNQVAYYVNGVGARGTHEQILGGTMGVGLHARVLDGYLLISRAYKPGDKIYLFGFSRGAYTVRSLAGLIAAVGLMPARQARSRGTRARANELWWRFKNGERTAQADAPDRNDPAPIVLIGVWDTVGSLGIPFFNGVHAFDWLEKKFFDFADKDLNKRVQYGRHALAIDESRADFKPTLWNAREGIEQRWFVGVHSDVGGGYPRCGLSDITLGWMIAEAANLGLVIDRSKTAGLAPDVLQDRHDETQKFIWQIRPHGPRDIPMSALFYPSVEERLADREDYRPASLVQFRQFSRFFTPATTKKKEKLIAPDICGPTLCLAPGKSVIVEVFAARWWNSTGLEVSAGESYRITAKDKWTDWHYTTDADGYEKRNLRPLCWARRVRDAPWFRLIASVAHDPTLETNTPSFWKATIDSFTGLDSGAQLVAIGKSGQIKIEHDGYLYLFANDAVATYENNSGSLTVEVKRM